MRFPPLSWALAVVCVTLHAEPVDSLITASDFLKIAHLAAPAVSSDSKQIAYTVRTIDGQPDGDLVYRNHLWIATTSGDTAPREFPSAGVNVHAPAWHPSGDRVAFVRPEQGDRARIWVQPVAGGEPVPVTPPLRGAASPQWSPDGTSLLFTAIVTFSEAQTALKKADDSSLAPSWSREKPGHFPPTAATVPSPLASAKPAAPGAKPVAPPPALKPSPDGTLTARFAWLSHNESERDPVVVHRPDLGADRFTEGELEFTHVFIIQRAGAEPVDLTPGFVSRTHPAWVPDGQSIICSGPSNDETHPDRVRTRQLFVLKTDGSGERVLHNADAWSFDCPTVSPDGKLVACTAQPAADPADLSYGQTRIAIIGVDDGNFRVLTDKLDRSAENPRWSPDGKHLYFTAEANGGTPLYRILLASGGHERITAADTWVTDYSVGSTDLAVVTARAGNPGELYRTSLAGRSSRILTAHNSEWLRDKKTALPERRKLKRPDGVEVEYWITKPPYLEGGFHYPLLLLVHGGPASMWGAANPAIWHEVQFFAARGYGVVFANPRGSSGYGHKFQRGSFQNWGPGPAGDVLAVADAVAKENWVDPDRQVILGGSYGAYLATWIISHDSRFKAAIAARGVYDLTTFFGEGDAWPLVPWHFGGFPWQPEIRKLLDAQSPLMRVDSIHTPLLIKQNGADQQTGLAQGELLYRSLKLLGRPVELVRYPGASHDLSRTGDPRQRLDRLVRFDAFFQRFVGTPARPIPPPPPATLPSTPAPAAVKPALLKPAEAKSTAPSDSMMMSP
jgi:dipeptidyl aminopeptidase/acylaminoacyl peptidase